MPRKRKAKRKYVSIWVYAERLRSNMTKAELVLWEQLRRHMTRWKVVFEPQGVVAARYVADFVCRQKWLVIELDGSIHRLARVRAKDKYRTKVLTRLGYRVVRFTNTQVLRNTGLVLEQILQLVKE